MATSRDVESSGGHRSDKFLPLDGRTVTPSRAQPRPSWVLSMIVENPRFVCFALVASLVGVVVCLGTCFWLCGLCVCCVWVCWCVRSCVDVYLSRFACLGCLQSPWLSAVMTPRVAHPWVRLPLLWVVCRAPWILMRSWQPFGECPRGGWLGVRVLYVVHTPSSIHMGTTRAPHTATWKGLRVRTMGAAA